eukprot:scaffold91517_cov40-Prasinocladus_malaysianus.AAC.1
MRSWLPTSDSRGLLSEWSYGTRTGTVIHCCRPETDTTVRVLGVAMRVSSKNTEATAETRTRTGRYSSHIAKVPVHSALKRPEDDRKLPEGARKFIMYSHRIRPTSAASCGLRRETLAYSHPVYHRSI